MDNFLFINVVITFVETRIKGKIDYDELAYAAGFSLYYIRERKIANAAFECSYTDKTLFIIGMEYGFNNADSFTRAFKRIVGVTPSEFRRMKVVIKRIKLCAGVYGIELPACLKASANYIGIDVSYDYTMAASGAAFRLTWDETEWNFFQDNPEFNRDITIDESGYFISEHWWDNMDTVAVMALVPTDSKKADIKTILNNAIEAMKGRKYC